MTCSFFCTSPSCLSSTHWHNYSFAFLIFWLFMFYVCFVGAHCYLFIFNIFLPIIYLITLMVAIVSNWGLRPAEIYCRFTTKFFFLSNGFDMSSLCLPIRLLNFAFSMRYAFSNDIIAFFLYISIFFPNWTTLSAVTCDVWFHFVSFRLNFN